MGNLRRYIAEINRINDCSILAAVGQNMCKTSGVSAMLFEALASATVNVVAISQGCSEYNITVVVSKKDVNKALRAVHGRFYLSKTVISVGLVGPGLVGRTLLRQMKEQLDELKEEYSVDLRVVGCCKCNLGVEPGSQTRVGKRVLLVFRS